MEKPSNTATEWSVWTEESGGCEVYDLRSASVIDDYSAWPVQGFVRCKPGMRPPMIFRRNVLRMLSAAFLNTMITTHTIYPSRHLFIHIPLPLP
jgi:hypothetical protein